MVSSRIRPMRRARAALGLMSRSTLWLVTALHAALLVACSGDPDLSAAESAARVAAAAEQSSREALSRVLAPASKALERLKGNESADVTALGQLRRLISADDFNDLLDDVLVELGFSPDDSARETIRRNRAEVGELTRRAQAIREQMAGAPRDENVGFFEDLYTKSQSDLKEELEDARSRITFLRAQDAELMRGVERELRELGLELNEEDVSTLLSTVTGEDFMELVVATSTVRGVASQLEALAAEPDAPAESARRYYGVYLVMLYAMERLHEQFVLRIEEDLEPRLAEIEREARRLIERSESRVEAGGDAAMAAQNRSANELTIRATKLYSSYLQQQADEIKERADALRSSIADAEITYETIRLSSEVAQIIREGLQDLDSLLNLQPPPIARLESPELREEFNRLSKRMASE